MPDMRYAPPNPLRIADRATGLNSVGVRSHNERLLLSLLLQNEAITRLEIGERTGLSAQTISVIVRSLEHEGLISRGEAQKSRVGPPTVPLELNPEGAFAVGVGVGHKRTDVVLINFVGNAQFHTTLSDAEMKLDGKRPELLETIRNAVSKLPEQARERLAGIGFGLPQSMSNNRVEQDASFKTLQDQFEEQLGIPVFVQNDITAAAGAESIFGVAKPLTNYMYFYLGANLHGRLVLNHQIHHGNSSVSFDVGMVSLEKELAYRGKPTAPLWERMGQWPDYGEFLDPWEKRLIAQMTRSLEAVNQFVEIDAVILSSYAPQSVCEGICRKLESSLTSVKAIASTLTPSPKAIGAASLPFSSRFMVQ